MVSMIQSVARLAHLTFNNVNKCQSEEVINESMNKLTKLLSQLSHKDLNLNTELMTDSPNRLLSLSLIKHLKQRRAPVSHVSVCETKDFQMCVFGLRHDSSRIPLHDHPDMYGMIKVVFGSVLMRHYTALPSDCTYVLPKEVSAKVSKRERDFLVPTLFNGQTTTDSMSEEVCVLTPNERNYHEVVAVGGPAAILDVLAPPYKEDRECHYYKVVASVFDQILNNDITWLLEIDPPQDYWCDSLPYNGPQVRQIDLL